VVSYGRGIPGAVPAVGAVPEAHRGGVNPADSWRGSPLGILGGGAGVVPAVPEMMGGPASRLPEVLGGPASHLRETLGGPALRRGGEAGPPNAVHGAHRGGGMSASPQGGRALSISASPTPSLSNHPALHPVVRCEQGPCTGVSCS